MQQAGPFGHFSKSRKLRPFPRGRYTRILASVHYLCRKCDWRLSVDAGNRSTPCENCGNDSGVIAPPSGFPVEACAACGSSDLYIQKDFNRATGLTLVVIGAIFVPWTWGLSLLAVTLLDVALYYILGDVTVCYACRAVHRGYPKNPVHGPFDLAVHDRHVYGAAPPGAEERH